jgi:hypothetical protein
MARYKCKRCGVESNTLDEPHLCKDLKKRHERNSNAISVVVHILEEHHLRPPRVDDCTSEEIAAEIVKALSGRDLGVD